MYRWQMRRLEFAVLLLAGFFGGAWAQRLGWIPGAERPEQTRLFAPFREAWRLVEQHYVDRSAVEPQRMMRGAIAGMLDSLGDTGHTTYLSPEQFQQMKESLAGSLQGIGARLSLHDKRPTIVNTLPGSPAERAGLKPGDILLEVDGKDVAALPLMRIVELVRGPPGTQVHLRVLRHGHAQPLDFTIARADVHVPEVTWCMVPGEPVAHLAVHEFGENADAQLRTALQQIHDHNARGLVVDVRGNPGGLKDQAVAVTSEFLTQGTVFIEQDAQGHRQSVPVKPGGQATDLPLVVLIDEGTASSAEIFAGAIQDHGGGKLIGTQTFGTGTVLEPFTLSDGSAVLLAVAEWFTPNGRQIWHHGIQPDVQVSLPAGTPILQPETEKDLDAAGLRHSADRQLLKALDVLKSSLKPGD
jgi:carboxyl-terminal processing protease